MPPLMQVEMTDNVTPWLKWAIEHKTDWTRKAIKSTAWYAQQEIKKGIKSGSPGGSAYFARMSGEKRHDIEDTSKRGGSKKKRVPGWMGRLLNAVGYQYKPTQVLVGWLSNSAVRIGGWQEAGVKQTVTPKMRRLFFAAGVGMKSSTTSITLPARPTYSPMFQYLRDKIPAYFQAKFVSYLNNGGPPSSQIGYRRKYIVRG